MKTKLFLANAFIVSAALFAFATPTFASSISSQMDIGATGADVTTLQTFLAEDTTIYPEGLVTGYFGPLTSAAVARWQTANGIDPVGRVGPITLAALNAAMGDAPGSEVAPSSGISVNPVISSAKVSTTANTATFSWNTNEQTNSFVLYSTVTPFLFANASKVLSTNGLSTVATATITGLTPNTTYYFSLQSSDTSGNAIWTVEQPFTTPNN